ncbi:DUF6978 family protein [Vagococcus hydrophili]|uniref:Uncharacterized protein n=1 Tax=Vagococcus hydrophili TaxID=2714947 RepID=A0A6G8AW83_9ENTE|nr:hypothetical protein [Vagococcus hydrophili]QIL49240.1 hypothetical protein G7082_12435 [Vagococcus hydrophili]
MDLDNLSDNEVKNLIKSLKNPTRLFAIEDINAQISTMFGNIDIDKTMIGVIDNIEYTLHIFRGKREANRYSINLRFTNKYHQLIRLDIGSNHTNPDNTQIIGDHIHFYSNKFPKRDCVAYPINVTDFPNVSNIIDAFNQFTLYTNIIE